jgi:hypothetical protein
VLRSDHDDCNIEPRRVEPAASQISSEAAQCAVCGHDVSGIAQRLGRAHCSRSGHRRWLSTLSSLRLLRRRLPETPAPRASAPGRVGSEQQNTAANSSPKAAASSVSGGPYHFQADVPCPYCLPGSKYPHGRTGLHWHDHWRSADLREALTIPALAAATIALTFVPTAKSPSWQSPLLLDSPARKLLRLHDASARKTAQNVSDVLFYWEIAHPALIDPLLVATWRRAPGVAWQISIINAQAYALTLLLNQATKRLTSRERPCVDVCDRDPTGQSCSSGARYTSFYGGHAGSNTSRLLRLFDSVGADALEDAIVELLDHSRLLAKHCLGCSSRPR